MDEAVTPEGRSARRRPLRVGLLLDSYAVRAWVARVLEEVDRAPWAEIVLVVLNAPGGGADGRVRRLWRRRRHFLYRVYSRLDRWLLRGRPDAFAVVNSTPLLSDRPTLRVSPERRRYSDHFPAEAIEQIRGHDLDVALRFGFRILRGEVLDVARYGVWSYHHGDEREHRGGPPGFWEVITGKPVTGSVLQRLTEELDAGEVLYRSYAPTHRRSVERNKHHLYWKSTAFVPRVLRALYDRGPAALYPRTPDEPRPDSGRLFRKPTNLEFARFFPSFALRATADKATEIATRSQWLLAFSQDPAATLDEESLARFRPIVPPRDRYWADPFPIRHGDRYCVFVEEYLYRARRGHVSVLEIGDDGVASQPVPVLETGYHLSYPFVFRWRDDYFMIPESAANRTVELHRCLDFPRRWSLETVLLQGVRAVDATLYENASGWWMFVNLAVEGTAYPHDELHLYRAESPLGPWSPHPRNPVKSDARSARPAGRLFERDGALFRPAQDCTGRYGRAIVLNQVLRLDDEVFEERVVRRIEPRWRRGLVATHTLNREHRLTVLDGMRRIVRFG